MRLPLAAALLLTAAPAAAQTPSVQAQSTQAPSTQAPAEPGATTAEGVGQVKAIDLRAGTITLHHGPIAALGWPAMTMSFKAAPEVLQAAKPGQTVRFTLDPKANQVLAIQPQ